MGYQPFTNNYTSPDPSKLAAIYARQAAKRAFIANQMNGGNQLMGALTTECCSDPAYGGQSWIGGGDPSTDPTSLASLLPGTPASAAVLPSTSPAAPSTGPYPPASFPLTPVDILTGTRGWNQQPNGKPWPRLRLPRSLQRQIANAYPNYGPTSDLQSLVTPCPCFGSGAPVVIPVPPALNSVPPNPTPAPAPARGNCPYPGCSTGNICLDLITGCVSNSQVTQAQVEACTEAGYSTFGNSGSWLSAILLGCGGNLPYLGAPLPNPPQATGSMEFILSTANAAGVAASQKARGMSGLGQDDSTSQMWGFLAVLAVSGIVVWASRK